MESEPGKGHEKNVQLHADEQKTREIDVEAVHVKEVSQFAGKKEPELFIGMRLIVECKKSETHAWVFFTRPYQYEIRPSIGEFQTFDFLEVLSNGKISLLDQAADEFGMPHLHYSRFNRQANTYSEVKLQKLQGQPSKPTKSEIFEAQNQLMKYMNYSNEQEAKKISRDVTRRDVLFNFLAIAFDGLLYEATLDDGKLALRRKNHVLLESRTQKGEYYQSCMIDVVSASWFPRYLKLLEKDVDEILSYFRTNRRKMIHKVESLIDAFSP
ncbi:MAG TPA: hypothetical protein VJZ32_03425 [Candidatus Bathyarchaeia archaeon]|nr:hypothetical protein [Candidatus Bathyarchaeia archaeon]